MTNRTAPPASTYPGAPVDDRQAFQVRRGPDGQQRLVPVGRQLRSQAEQLVATVVAMIDEDAPARTVCFVANKFKLLDPSLNGHRYLSMDTCRRALRRLEAGADEAA